MHYSATPDIIAFPSTHKTNLLKPSQLKTLKAGTLRLLDEVGVHFPSRRALEIFADCGATVDWKSETVCIPPDLVEKAMATAPRSFVLGGREERFDLLLDGSLCYLATDGTGVHVIDLETREVRASRKEDVAMMARVCDALPLISFYWPMVSAQDYGHTAPLHQCHASLTNTLKHVRGGMTVPPTLAPLVVEMATVVAGSAEMLRRRSPICANFCTIAPLAQDGHSIDNALTYAEAGIPMSFMAMPTMGSTAPATPLGALVMGDAEVVSSMVLVQLACPGTPVFHSNYVSLMHPRTGAYVAELPIPVNWIAVQMAHGWGVPSLGGGSVSVDAAKIGWRAGLDTGSGAMMIPFYGGEVCGYLGLTDSSMVLCPELMILQHEACWHAYELLHGFEFDESDMALDVIANVGPRGHFLAQKHTRKHIRDFRLPLLEQEDAAGHPCDAQEVALEEFRRLNETHHPEPLPVDVLAELDRILAAAEREADRIG
ncbi:MAG: trimethylamine methyltransferase family protein [Anaerolineae bacterium]|jgi:trimethylamine--corrinoid protein Co-methyltransferase